MRLNGSIHASYHLTHEMVLMYLIPTIHVHMSEYKSTTRDMWRLG
jgi:hypothetical protein